MAAHLGTGVQMAAVGPQDAYLSLDPEVTAFRSTPRRSSRFAAEERETLPLQTARFGTRAIFELAHDGDMLGDMYVQVRVPAVQPELGEGLAPSDAPPTSGPGDATGPQPGLGSVSVALAGWTGAGERRFMEGGGGYVFTFDLGGGAAWRVDMYYSGLVRSTLTGPSAATARQLRVSVAGALKATLTQHGGRSVAAFVGGGGAVVARNDEWRGPLAYLLMRRVRFVVDGLALHDHERLLYDVVDRLATRAGHAAGLGEMLGRGLSMGRPHLLHLPLKFMCCTGCLGKRAYFPLVLLPNSRLVVEFEVESFAACMPSAPVGPPPSPPPSLDVRLVAEHVWLDADERNTLLLSGTFTMMVGGAQDMDGLNYSESAVDDAGRPVPTRYATVDLSELNLPVRALAWVVYEEPVSEYFRYLDVVEEAVLLFGSTERAAGDGPDFAKRQVWSHAGRCAPGDNVHLLSFALDAFGADPSGACNFSLMQKPVLRLRLSAAVRRVKAKVFGLTYNWLAFEKGKMRQVFSV